jgi:hypothetical protein
MTFLPACQASYFNLPPLSFFNLGDLVKIHRADGFDCRGNPPGCPISGGSASRPYLQQRRGCNATPAPPDVCREKAFVKKGMKGLGLETSGPGLNGPGEKMAF